MVDISHSNNISRNSDVFHSKFHCYEEIHWVYHLAIHDDDTGQQEAKGQHKQPVIHGESLPVHAESNEESYKHPQDCRG
ncbi:hypothetical protein RIB2604_01806270 [Aspergillus luchuensis]|uniref:Uncharacterized protein n=1 Tax=Aspergillus kawachii TaxID=1069201 RepID=A0A146FFZ7_ASPKA|nr:hypothetical protein RIB2604_01806270 [Aspergillus luchuensis]